MRAVLLPSRHRHAMRAWIARARAWRLARHDARGLTEERSRMAFLIWKGHARRFGQRRQAIRNHQLGSYRAAWGGWAAWAATCRLAPQRVRERKRATLEAAWQGLAAHAAAHRADRRARQVTLELISRHQGQTCMLRMHASMRAWVTYANAGRPFRIDEPPLLRARQLARGRALDAALCPEGLFVLRVRYAVRCG